ncbi:MAG: hypothetical protein ACLQGP_25215 [Isosphaeraceae bacterium]
MALHYQTEYRLGNRGRISRSYTGFQAFVAICLDLIFGLLFEFVAAMPALAARLLIRTFRLSVRVIKLNWKLLVAAMTLIVYIVTLPFALLHRAVVRLRSGTEADPGATPNLKPSWALAREV